MIASPAGDSRRKRPKRVTTPENPCGTILMAEASNPMSSPGYDHLGLLMETRTEVDSTLAECRIFQKNDPRLCIKEYEDLIGPTVTVHAFYVKYLLPIWFDIQSMEWPAGKEPDRRWRYS